MAPTPDQLLQALAAVKDPNTEKDFVSTKALKNLQVTEGSVAFDVELGYPAKSQIPALRAALIAAAKGVAGVQNVSVNIFSKIVAYARDEYRQSNLLDRTEQLPGRVIEMPRRA